MKTFKVLFNASALCFSIWYLNHQRSRASQGRCVCRFMRSNGIEEEIELFGDGTYRQAVTDSQGNAFHNFGAWSRIGGFTEMLDSYGRSAAVVLENHVDPLEVVRKKSVDEARKKSLAYPLYAFLVKAESA